jgi:hypothetical protein
MTVYLVCRRVFIEKTTSLLLFLNTLGADRNFPLCTRFSLCYHS